MSLPNVFITTLAQSLATGGSESEVYVSSITTLDGQTISTADFSQWGRGVLTIDPQSSSRVEFVSFTAVDGAGIGFTGATRGLSFKDNTSITANKKYHPVGSTVIISFGTHNMQDMVDKFADVAGNETITGLWTFSQTPNGINPGGVVDASTTQKGYSRLSATPSIALGNPTISIASPAVVSLSSHGLTVNDMIKFTTTGSLPTGLSTGTTYYVISAGLTGSAFELSLSQGGAAINTSGTQSGTHTLYKVTPVAVATTDVAYGTNNHATSTGSSNAYVVTLPVTPASYVKGQVYSFLSNFANTGACTVNINGLGAKTIKKLGGATDLASGDIASGMIVSLEYDGTYMIMLNPVANVLTVGFDGTRITRLAGSAPINNTSENTIYTTTITGGIISANGMIRVSTPVSIANQTSGSTYTIRVKYGGTTLISPSIIVPTIGGTDGILVGEIRVVIINNGATNSQNVGVYFIGGINKSSASFPNNVAYTTGFGDTTSAIDTTANQTLALSVQSSGGVGVGGITFYQSVVETIKNA